MRQLHKGKDTKMRRLDRGKIRRHGTTVRDGETTKTLQLQREKDTTDILRGQVRRTGNSKRKERQEHMTVYRGKVTTGASREGRHSTKIRPSDTGADMTVNQGEEKSRPLHREGKRYDRCGRDEFDIVTRKGRVHDRY